MEILMLGTGSALVTECYNTCFAIINDNREPMLVDAGGGNGIIKQLKLSGISINDIHDMFVTHPHTDHILGAVWVVRNIAQNINSGKYSGTFTLRGHNEVISTLRTICLATLPNKVTKHIGDDIILDEATDGSIFHAIGMQFTAFDICSTKAKQYGFTVILPNGGKLTCLGDEPFNEHARQYAENSKWLLCEAFCLYSQRNVFKPYEKHHSTALDAGRIAESLHAKNLLLYHTEDTTLATRRTAYAAEASQAFSGNIIVPDDLERIIL